MRWTTTMVLSLGALSWAAGADAGASRSSHGSPARSFKRVATLPNYLNNASANDETVSEIVASTADGNTLLYTDGELGELGFVDATRASAPTPMGKLALGGEPTSVSVLGNRFALVGVNTSESLVSPSGHVAVVDVARQLVVHTIPLGGQPDSLAISPDGSLAAVAIENERDEEVFVAGVEGGLPQAPAGFLAIIDLQGRKPNTWSLRRVDLTGLSEYAPSDPEPEFVDINRDNRAVVTLQENNHVIVVDLERGRVESDFSAGTQTLVGVDATEDDRISLSETLEDVPREPDAVTWIPGRGRHPYVATANEGDLWGGSRGFSIFDAKGRLVFDSGAEFDELAVRHGHYPEARSENKGSEPEAIEYGRFGDTDYLFVGSERGSFVAVYELRQGQPTFAQLLPGPLGPEGLLAIPSRNLLVVSGEVDDPEFGVRSSMMIYELGRGAPNYPQIASADDEAGKPIPWSALSGLTAAPKGDRQLLAVSDSFYSELTIFNIDASRSPAVIVDATPVVGGSGNFDGEGIAVAPDGSYWIASEGDASGARPNRLLQTDPAGQVLQEVFLPVEIEACRAVSDNRGSLGAGFEGVAISPRRGGGYDLLVAQQRGWDYTTAECEDLDDDPTGVNAGEPTQTRIWRYRPETAHWSHHAYELAPLPPHATWVGLSEITRVPRGFIVIERDNRTGDFAELKTLAKFSGQQLRGGVSADEKRVYDLLPDLLQSRGWVSDKAEGLAVTRDGHAFVVTDNDGVDDWSGETWFLSLGRERTLF